MKTLFSSLVLSVLVMLIFSCGGDDTSGQDSDEAAADTTAVNVAEETETSNIAICLWGKVGLREEAGAKAKYLTTIYFGEKIELLGESQEIESEKRTYVKVGLSDGKEGWVNEYLIATDAELAVASNTIDVYRRPDLMTASGKKLERGEIVAVMETDKEGWVQILGKEKAKEGWVQTSGNNLTTHEVDVTVAVLVQKAMQEDTPAKKEEALKVISENSTFQTSIFIDLVETKLGELSAVNNLDENQLSITATKINVRSLPSVEESEVLFQLEEGAICNVLRRTDEKMDVNGNTDYWYKVEHNGESGWVFGFHTTKKDG